MWRKWGRICSVWILGISAMAMGNGCVHDSDEEFPGGEEQETGMALRVDFEGETDVTGFSFTISDCRNEDVVMGDTKSLDELILPGAGAEEGPEALDEDSRHRLVDYFAPLQVGCYDVEVQPLNGEGIPSVDCGPTRATEVFVVYRMTTEILLVSPCRPGSTELSQMERTP
jgi:hypothetical protein